MRSKPPEMTVLGRVGQPRLLESRRVLTLILTAALVWSLLNVGWRDGVLHAGGLAALRDMGGALLTPDLSGEVLAKLVGSVWRTLAGFGWL